MSGPTNTEMTSLRYKILKRAIDITHRDKPLTDKCKNQSIINLKGNARVDFLNADKARKAQKLFREICDLIDDLYGIYIMIKDDNKDENDPDLIDLNKTIDLLIPKYEKFKNSYITKYQCKCSEANLMFIDIVRFLGSGEL